MKTEKQSRTSSPSGPTTLDPTAPDRTAPDRTAPDHTALGHTTSDHPGHTTSDHNVVRGTVDLLILKSLTWGARHGYSISEWIEQATDHVLPMEEGTLYPALHRLANKGWIQAEWGVSENKRRAKFYQLTPKGRSRLTSESAAWTRYVEAAARALNTPVEEAS